MAKLLMKISSACLIHARNKLACQAGVHVLASGQHFYIHLQFISNQMRQNLVIEKKLFN